MYRPQRPVLLLPGSGKSTLAPGLGGRPGWADSRRESTGEGRQHCPFLLPDTLSLILRAREGAA